MGMIGIAERQFVELKPKTRAQLQAWAEVFSVHLSDLLRGTGIQAEMRLSLEGAELRLTMRYSGALTIRDPDVLEPGIAMMNDNVAARIDEAKSLVHSMRRALAKAAQGELDT